MRGVGVRIVRDGFAMPGVRGMRAGVGAFLLAGRRPLARATRTCPRNRDQSRKDRPEQGQKYNGLVHLTSSALHQIDVFDPDRAAVAVEHDENGKPDGGFRRRHREHQ